MIKRIGLIKVIMEATFQDLEGGFFIDLSIKESTRERDFVLLRVVIKSRYVVEAAAYFAY